MIPNEEIKQKIKIDRKNLTSKDTTRKEKRQIRHELVQNLEKLKNNEIKQYFNEKLMNQLSLLKKLNTEKVDKEYFKKDITKAINLLSKTLDTKISSFKEKRIIQELIQIEYSLLNFSENINELDKEEIFEIIELSLFLSKNNSFLRKIKIDITLVKNPRDKIKILRIFTKKLYEEKIFSSKEKGNLQNFKIKNLLLKGVPGTGKSRAIENIINDELKLKDHKENILRINIHSASSNADLMQGIGISSKDGKIEYKEKQGLILNLIQRATFSPKQPFVLILEEIQENSLNELIGDLIYLIEDSKRAKNMVADDGEYAYQELIDKIIEDNPETDYVEIPHLVDSTTQYKKMIMPDNLYIFCTSNYRDDKKVIEDNLLRRFEVLEIYPKESVVHEYCRDFFRGLNENILKELSDEIHPDRFLIGHSNWLEIDNKEKFYRAFLKVVVEFKDIKELEFEDFKKIVQSLPLVDGLELNTYKSLIENLQEKAGYDFLT